MLIQNAISIVIESLAKIQIKNYTSNIKSAKICI